MGRESEAFSWGLLVVAPLAAASATMAWMLLRRKRPRTPSFAARADAPRVSLPAPVVAPAPEPIEPIEILSASSLEPVRAYEATVSPPAERFLGERAEVVEVVEIALVLEMVEIAPVVEATATESVASAREALRPDPPTSSVLADASTPEVVAGGTPSESPLAQPSVVAEERPLVASPPPEATQKSAAPDAETESAVEEPALVTSDIPGASPLPRATPTAPLPLSKRFSKPEEPAPEVPVPPTESIASPLENDEESESEKPPG